ncbi:MAG: S8 family serine peptidase, partial [Acidimicrobiales bacterium]
GTSQAAAVTSGVAARMLDHFPDMDLNELKATLIEEAETDLDFGPSAIGNGVIDAEDAWEEPVFGVDAPSHPHAAGPGTGLSAPTGSTWSGGTWSGSTWSGSTWSGSTWSGGTWSGSTWSGSTWSGSTWSGSTWSGSTWSGSTWSGTTWSGSTWSGSTWSGNGWS